MNIIDYRLLQRGITVINAIESALHIPKRPALPEQAPNFSYLRLQAPGDLRRPELDAPEETLRDLPHGLIGVLDDEHQAVGPWNPGLTPDQGRRGLKAMVLARRYDDAILPAQRIHAGQHRTKPFFMQSAGEEAIGAGPAMVLRSSDMCFPTYRVVAYLMARNYPLPKLVNQVFSSTSDPLKGHQLPILYSAREYGFCSISGNVGSRIGHAVGWAMASAYKGDDKIALAYIGEGATAEGDFHEALTFASVYRAPVIIAIVNNQWAISTFQNVAGPEGTTFAQRALGYGLPGLRVDGNDFLAVWAATEWAAARARRNLGATVIEFVTYRAGAHSTSDDPRRYRPADDAEHWPMGDPIERLKRHLIGVGEWSEKAHLSMEEEVRNAISSAIKAGERLKSLADEKANAALMFEDVFKEPDWRLLEQRRELGV